MALYTVDNTKGMDVDVFLNNRKYDNVIQADTDKGFIEVYKLDNLGSPIVDYLHDIFKTEFIHGIVEVNVSEIKS